MSSDAPPIVCLAIETPIFDTELQQDPDSIAYYARELIRAKLYDTLLWREGIEVDVQHVHDDEYDCEDWYIEARGLLADEVYTFIMMMRSLFTVYNDNYEPPEIIENEEDWGGEDAEEGQGEE